MDTLGDLPDNDAVPHWKITLSIQRCFIALDLPDGIRQAGVNVQEALRSSTADLRFTDPKQLHLTLKFLGEIAPEVVQQVQARLEDIRCGPFELASGDAGCFAPRIVWLVLLGADELQRRVDAALDGLFDPERRFMGHVTIARSRTMSPRTLRAVEAVAVPRVTGEVTHFSLQVSHLHPEGARHEELSRHALI